MCDTDSFVQNNSSVADKVKHFEENVIFNPDNKGKVLYMLFKADWCGACRNFKPVFFECREACKKENKKDMIMVVIDNDSSPALFEAYRVTSLPTTFVYKIDDNLLNNKHKKLEILESGKIVGADINRFSELVRHHNNL